MLVLLILLGLCIDVDGLVCGETANCLCSLTTMDCTGLPGMTEPRERVGVHLTVNMRGFFNPIVDYYAMFNGFSSIKLYNAPDTACTDPRVKTFIIDCLSTQTPMETTDTPIAAKQGADKLVVFTLALDVAQFSIIGTVLYQILVSLMYFQSQLGDRVKPPGIIRMMKWCRQNCKRRTVHRKASYLGRVFFHSVYHCFFFFCFITYRSIFFVLFTGNLSSTHLSQVGGGRRCCNEEAAAGVVQPAASLFTEATGGGGGEHETVDLFTFKPYSSAATAQSYSEGRV